MIDGPDPLQGFVCNGIFRSFLCRGVLLMHPQNTASHASYSSSEIILGHSDLNIIKHYAKVDIENLRLCDLDPPRPKVIFADYLSGKKVVRHV